MYTLLTKEYNVMALVFQYGSNTSSKRLNSSDRLQGDAKPVGIAYTRDDFELDFTVWSTGNQCAAADIVPGSGRKIWGVLYEIPDHLIRRDTAGNRRSLDDIEGEGTNYQRMTISLKYPNGRPVKPDAITYVVKDRKKGLQTSLEYVCHIIVGLHEHGVPEEYIEYVKMRIVKNNPSLKEEMERM